MADGGWRMADCGLWIADCGLLIATTPGQAIHAGENDAPHLLIHGTHDCTVPTEQARHLQQALLRGGVDVTLITPKGEHEIHDFPPHAPHWQRVHEWLYHHLNNHSRRETFSQPSLSAALPRWEVDLVRRWAHTHSSLKGRN